MNTDLLLTVGIVVGAISIPALLSAFSESRAPRAGAILVLIATGLIATALVQKPSGYRFEEIPGVMIGVFAKLVN